MAAEKPKDLFLLSGISCLCFNRDFTECALSQRDSNIYIYKIQNLNDTDSWNLLYTLSAHFLYVSGLDWCPSTNNIISCSHDKTSIIWSFEGDKWLPSYAVGTAEASFLFCHWNNDGTKFVEGTGDRKLFIGYSDIKEDGKWWMLWNIKAHKSSVTCARISPDSLKVISGSTDMRFVISSCYIEKVDTSITEEQRASAGKFGETLFILDVENWVNDVAWSLDGRFAFATTQKSQVFIYDNNATDVINSEYSPFTMVVPTNNNEFYAVSYDRIIYLYSFENDKWVLKKTVKKAEDKDGDLKNTGAKSMMPQFGGMPRMGGGLAKTLKMFESQGMKKKMDQDEPTSSKEALHSTMISSISIKDNQIITADYAGFVKFWNI